MLYFVKKNAQTYWVKKSEVKILSISEHNTVLLRTNNGVLCNISSMSISQYRFKVWGLRYIHTDRNCL